jgi:hypothetical protein
MPRRKKNTNNRKKHNPKDFGRAIRIPNGAQDQVQAEDAVVLGSPKGFNGRFFQHENTGKNIGFTPKKGNAVLLKDEHHGRKHALFISPEKNRLYREGDFDHKPTPEEKSKVIILELKTLKLRIDEDNNRTAPLGWRHIQASYIKMESCLDMLFTLRQLSPRDFSQCLLDINEAIASDNPATALYNPFGAQTIYLYEATTGYYIYDRAAAKASMPALGTPLTEADLLARNAPSTPSSSSNEAEAVDTEDYSGYNTP